MKLLRRQFLHLGVLPPQPPVIPTAQAVASGEAEIVVVGVALIHLAPDAELVGWLPPEIAELRDLYGGPQRYRKGTRGRPSPA